MVHALKEIWRVLVPDGYLIDMRPFTDYRPVEIVTPDEVFPVGFIDSSAGHPDDIVANKAVDHMVTSGYFIPSQNDSFEFHVFWDSVDELRDHMTKSKMSKISPDILAKADELISQHGATARLRTRRHMIIGCYQKNNSGSG